MNLNSVLFTFAMTFGPTALAAAASSPEPSSFARAELARTIGDPRAIEHGHDRWSRPSSGAQAHHLVQIVLLEGTLQKFAVPIAAAPAQVRAFVAADPPWPVDVAAWPSVTPWVRVTLANEATGVERTLTLAVGRRTVRAKDGWHPADVRVQRFWRRAVGTEEMTVRLGPADEDGVFRTLRMDEEHRVGKVRVPTEHGDILGFRVEGRRLLVTTADKFEREYRIKINQRRLLIIPPADALPAFTPAVRATFPAARPSVRSSACESEILDERTSDETASD